jgi:hypothetical protein
MWGDGKAVSGLLLDINIPLGRGRQERPAATRTFCAALEIQSTNFSTAHAITTGTRMSSMSLSRMN